jgi:hypothetical protein
MFKKGFITDKTKIELENNRHMVVCKLTINFM